MNAKTNMLAFSIYFFCSTLLFSSCRDQNQSHLENTNAASNVDTSNQMEKLRRTSELQKILGKPVNADRAHELTKNYWNTLDIISKADSAKSVYFAKKELDDFAQNYNSAFLRSAVSLLLIQLKEDYPRESI